MLVFVLRRVLISIPVLIASTILTFLIVKLSGNPLSYLLSRSPRPPESVIRGRENELWLNRSWPSQYWHWMSGILFHWNFGPAVQSTQSVRSELFGAFGITARLVVASVVIALALAVVTGVVSAVKQYSATD